ncbi:cytochrome P450 71A1-like [Chenopodium quinoa]|uniref:cytochrome P450 71A1-like n=1 Tax=Chenopodium quinoa TaxID=63459 RepID=UPI000B789B16|nr:cytochrome P450 71A1-like [Chenopodium quinoa]
METLSSLYLINFLQELIFHPLFLSFMLFVILLYKSLSSNPSNGKNLPPSPPKLPVIGNLHQLGLLPHRSLQSLSRRYGKVMLLCLGNRPTLVVSSADAAEEIMKTNDLIFYNRPSLRNATRLFDGKDVAFAPCGEYWRQMRSICVMKLLSNKKVQSFRKIREEEVAVMVDKLNSLGCSVVNLAEFIVSFTYDVICRASFGRKYRDNEGDINFKNCIEEGMKLLGTFFLGDFVPCLSLIDRVKGLEGRLEKVAQELDAFVHKVIKEHQFHLSTNKSIVSDNFVDILLRVHMDNKHDMSLDSIKAVILDMFAAGTDTTYTLVEWVVIELIRNPRVMKELQKELRKIVGGKGRKVCEDDLEKLTYLKAVIKEALRIHPPGPLLVIRESLQDSKVNGFDIDAGTLVIINAWAIQTDPIYWEEPEQFRPERFLNSSNLADFKGQDFRYIPFGAGRRGCPGISFALANAELVIATLLNEFELTLPGDVQIEKIDMTEITGLTVRRRDPLMVIATPSAYVLEQMYADPI